MNTITHRMSGDEAALWTTISTFEIDGPDTTLTFAARLARENGWSTRYTERVMGEYRKFLFLCCVTPSGVTPSDPIDQAWHLHLTYTKSYWVDLCRNTLRRELHHNPTKGGATEGQKFDGMYSHSQALYAHYFGENPPADVWQPNAERFSDIDFERINRRTNWVIPKPDWVKNRTVWLGIGILAVVGLFIQAQGSTVVILLVSFGLFALLIYGLMNIDLSNERRGRTTDGGDSGGTFFLFGDGGGDKHHGDGHHGGDHGSDGGGHGDGGSGCSASGCSSGCSGCGGGCGS